jgi:two-component system, NtrC family, sensor kinase
MFIGLRITIFWNLCLLMVLSAVLTSFVAYRVMEQEVFREGSLAGRAVFSAIAAGTTRLFEQAPDPRAREAELRIFFKRQVESGACTELVLIDTKNRVIAEAPGPGNRQLLDADTALALQARELTTRLDNRLDAGGLRIIAASPLWITGQAVGALRATMPLKDMHQSMRRAYRLVLFYIITSAAILIAVGFLFFTRYLISPMQRLIRQTEDIARENLSDAPLLLSGGNEIQKLAAALKSLAENLKIERERIQEHVHALEEKNEQLRNARQENIQSEKLASVGRLAAGIAHEVGNPLGIILGYIHLLRSPDTTPAQHAEYLQRLEHETGRIKNTIGDLLNFAQPSSQEVAGLDLDDIVRDICAMVSCHKEFRTIQIVQELAPGLPPLRGNDRLVRQMLLNLALNACDAMQGRGGRLTITTALDPAGKIRLTVADTGHGIAPEHQEKIFDPFFTTRDYGTGLGLANVHRIIEVMEGSISFATTPGEGTVFTILLPAGISTGD